MGEVGGDGVMDMGVAFFVLIFFGCDDFQKKAASSERIPPAQTLGSPLLRHPSTHPLDTVQMYLPMTNP